jgi:elongation factor G
MIEERLGVRTAVLHLPIGEEAGFHGVVDLVAMRALYWPSDRAGAPMETGPVPPELLPQVEAARARLLDAVADQDEAALEAYVRDGDVPEALLHAALRRGTLAGAVVPVLAGSAFKNKGVEPLLDAVNAYLPAPEDIAADASHGEGQGAAGPFAALAFKLVHDEHGAMVFVRVYQGRVRVGDVLLNTSTGQKERIGRLYEVHADKRLERTELVAGDIAGIVGLKSTLTGHTLSDPAHPVVLESITVPEPVIDVAVEPRTQADQQALSKALQALVREDPSLHLRQDPETGQTLLSGMGELQLEVSLEKLRARHGVEVNVGRPQVAYRETITRTAEVTHLHKKQSGGPGQFAQVVLRLEPLERGEGVRFVSEVVGGAVPREFIPAVEAGVRRAAQVGAAAGFPVVDFEATLVDGAFHEKDSSALAFELAAAAAFREAASQAGPVVLEPVMDVEVVTPPDHLGDVIGDLMRRRGVVRAQDTRGHAAVVEAHVPLGEMFGYIGQLRALSHGRAQYAMHLDHLGELPANLVAKATAH